ELAPRPAGVHPHVHAPDVARAEAPLPRHPLAALRKADLGGAAVRGGGCARAGRPPGPSRRRRRALRQGSPRTRVLTTRSADAEISPRADGPLPPGSPFPLDRRLRRGPQTAAAGRLGRAPDLLRTGS